MCKNVNNLNSFFIEKKIEIVIKFVKTLQIILYTMPVLTRSQLKQTNVSSDKESIILNASKKNNTPTIIWFIGIIKKYLKDMDDLHKKQTENSIGGYEFERECIYDQIRVITEMFYIVNIYYPVVSPAKFNDSWKNLTNTFYNKIQDMYTQIRFEINNNVNFYKTIYHYNVIKAALEQLHDTENMIIPYLEEPKKPRRCPVVIYTGMDTIEPYCESHDITDIWRDESVTYDANYDPLNEEAILQRVEDNEDDDNFEKYVVDEDVSDSDSEYSDKDEDYVDEVENGDEDYVDEVEDEDEYEEDENEIYEKLIQSKAIQSKAIQSKAIQSKVQATTQNKHIRFSDE